MRRFLAVCLAFVAAFAFSACASNGAKETPQIENKPYVQHSESSGIEAAQREPQPVEELPSFQEMTDGIDSFMGHKYKVAGRVTDVDGGFRGADYMVHVYWDESETYGEVAAVRIPYKNYKESVNRYFEGTCTLEGLDDEGHPQFVCYAYFVEQQ